MLKNNDTTTYALKDGNAASGGLTTAGYPSAATDNAIQANIVAAGYRQVPPTFPVTGTPTRSPTSTVATSWTR